MGYEIIPVRGHYEVYDNRGNFICSADTRYEAFSELEEADELEPPCQTIAYIWNMTAAATTDGSGCEARK